jgi:hypothetical protein
MGCVKFSWVTIFAELQVCMSSMRWIREGCVEFECVRFWCMRGSVSFCFYDRGYFIFKAFIKVDREGAVFMLFACGVIKVGFCMW